MSILTSLAEIGRIFSDKLKEKISEVHAPHVIIETIFVEPPGQRGGEYYEEIKIGHPAARAYEWGSGLHAERGKKGKYPIPREATGVAFPKERWPGYRPPPPAPEIFVFDQIQHPGVSKRPFIVPTIMETREEFRVILGKGFKAELLIGTNKVEVIEVK